MSAPAPSKTAEQASMLANRVAKRARHLRRWAKREGVSCYRVYDRDIPEIPLAIDWYDGRLHVAEFVRPHDRSEQAHQAWLDALVAATAEALGVAPGEVFQKRRQRQRGAQQYQRVDETGHRLVVSEGGLRFIVNLRDYLDTGLFLDQRATRALVRAEAQGRDVLNLFAYTGSFTVYAAAGGARRTCTVDLSATYCDWARENLRLNGITPDHERHRVLHDDVLAWLEQERRSPRRYGLVVLDPPTFSNSKRMGPQTFDVQRDHAALLDAVWGVTRPDGAVWFSTNARRFHLDERALGRGVRAEELSEVTQTEDFKQRRGHRLWRLTRTAPPRAR
jgi:23S rRNA G2069 N7-methylase RlmK/C1962 C5-methylase RlmI